MEANELEIALTIIKGRHSASFFFRVCHTAAAPVHSYAEAAVQAEMDPAGMAAA